MLDRINKRLRSTRDDQAGFTLIELLIVITILGILAAIVVFSVRGITDRGETSACKAELQTLRTAQEAFYASQTTNPAYASDVATLKGKFINSTPEYWTLNSASTHLDKIEPVGTLPSGCAYS